MISPTHNDEFLWTEKYRPVKIDECVLPPALLETFKKLVEKGEVQNMLLSGSGGLGKTTVAKALCAELGVDYMMINGSEESGIDVLRNRIKQFASTMSITSDGPKVVILDEADYLNANSTQPALRGFIEEFSRNCRFIFTCNHKARIIEPLHSRCAVIEFNTPRSELPALAGKFFSRFESILKSENVSYDKKVAAEIVKRYAPDWRRVLNEAQRFSGDGTLNPLILTSSSSESLNELVTHLKNKDFKQMRVWVANNVGVDSTALIRQIYDSLYSIAKTSDIPSAVLVLADYSFKAAFVADKELNLVACLTDLMSNVEFKNASL